MYWWVGILERNGIKNKNLFLARINKRTSDLKKSMPIPNTMAKMPRPRPDNIFFKENYDQEDQGSGNILAVHSWRNSTYRGLDLAYPDLMQMQCQAVACEKPAQARKPCSDA